MKKTTLILTMFFLSFGIFAQDSEPASKKTEISLEIDPATFVFEGYGFHLRIKPKNSDHIVIGAGIYAMNFPDLLVGLNPENKDKGWDVRLDRGIGLFGEYHFSEVHNGWFVGTQLAVQDYKVKKDFYDGSETFTNSLAMGYGGYTFRPFADSKMYFKTWAGLAHTAKISGENKLGDAEYDVSPILMFAALHIGYTF